MPTLDGTARLLRHSLAAVPRPLALAGAAYLSALASGVRLVSRPVRWAPPPPLLRRPPRRRDEERTRQSLCPSASPDHGPGGAHQDTATAARDSSLCRFCPQSRQHSRETAKLCLEKPPSFVPTGVSDRITIEEIPTGSIQDQQARNR